MASSVIFIGTPEKSPRSPTKTLQRMLLVAPGDLMFRIFAAFVPPVSKKYQKVYVDFLGPLLAVLMLAGFVNYGYSLKSNSTVQAPIGTVFAYSTVMPVACFILCKLGGSHITLSETVSLLNYGLYGHILTLLFSYASFQERSNFFFFVCLIVFGGLSTLRIALVVLGTLRVPAARLVICSIVSIVNVLFAIFLHFAYMHRTFVHKAYSNGV